MFQTIQTLTWRLYTKLLRVGISLSQRSRPTSFPYVTGDGFRSIAQHIYDNDQTFDPANVQERHIVFVQSDKIDEYFARIHPQIRYPYKLITHNSDRNITEKDLVYIDEMIIAWFAQNVSVFHNKLIPIPIGLENKKLFYAGIPWVFDYFGAEQKTAHLGGRKAHKTNKILAGFNIDTNPEERGPARDALSNNPLIRKLDFWPNQYKYVDILSQYRFIASPPGNGLDCHRTWEAMYVSTIPVVKRSECTEYFQKIGLPVHIVDDWHELNELDAVSLSELYDSIMAKSDKRSLYMDYWIEKIRLAQ